MECNWNLRLAMLADFKGQCMGTGGNLQQDQSTAGSKPLGLISSSSITVLRLSLRTMLRVFASVYPFVKSFAALWSKSRMQWVMCRGVAVFTQSHPGIARTALPVDLSTACAPSSNPPACTDSHQQNAPVLSQCRM